MANLRKERTAGALITLGAIATMLAGCETHVPPKQNPDSSIRIGIEMHEPQIDKRLAEFVDKYNQGSIEEKSRIINELYAGTAVLIPFQYNYPWKYHVDYGNATAGIEGRVGAYYSKRGTGPGFEISSEDFDVDVGRDGKIVPSFTTGVALHVPKGYSVLKAPDPLTPEQVNETLWALRRFGNEFPELGIRHTGREAVRKGLELLGYSGE